MSAIADARERERALDTAASFHVQAPAGSGKTELLTQRTLALLAIADEPEEVVAITFTRKAAAEMRARVFAAIREARLPAPEDAHARHTWTLARRALERSRLLGWQLERSAQRLRITTIDALAAAIAQQSPLLSELGGAVVVEDDPQELYRQAARATLGLLEDADHGAAVATVLAHYDNRVQALEQDLAQLLPRRDQWLRLALQASPQARREAMEAVLRDCADSALQSLQALLPHALALEWHALARYAADNRRQGNAGMEAQHAYAPEDLPHWQEIIALALTKDGDWRKSFDVRLGFPPGETAQEKRVARQFKDRAKALIGDFQRIDGLGALLARIRALPPIHFSDAQWAVMLSLLDTLKLAAGELGVLFAGGGAVDFVEIGLRAVRALGDEGSPTDLALRLDYRIRHLLVDEFQDTSRLQLDLLRALTAGWQPGDGRTLFVVGDPAQSIYRFREAEVGYFIDARRHGLFGIALEPLQLACNFRSAEGLVDWSNATFPGVLAPEEDAVRGAVAYAAAVATREALAGPAVEVHASIGGDARSEAQSVVQTLSRLRDAEPQASIAVLVRSRSHLRELAPALRLAQMRYQAVDIEDLASRPVIDDLRALTRALLHPADRVAWLAVLRAPWCGLTLEDLHALAHGVPRGTPLAPSLRDPARASALSADARARLASTLAILQTGHLRQGRLRLRAWIEETWLALGGPACCLSAVDLADAARYFSVLDQLGQGGDLPSLAALDRALKDLRAAPDPDGGLLQVMTIHKAKGLEFDHVLVPSLHRTTGRDDPPPLAWTTIATTDGPGLLMAPIAATGAEDDRAYRFVRSLEKEKHAWEDGRLLYVACTRARRSLHLFGDCRADAGAPLPPAQGSLLHKLWSAVAHEFARACEGASVAADELPEMAAPTPPPLRRFAPGWRPPVVALAPMRESSGPTTAFDWASGAARAVGVVAHRWLQHIAESGAEHWPQSRIDQVAPAIARALAAEGLAGDEHASAHARVLEALRNALADERGQWVLRGDHQDARCELVVATSVDGVPRQWVVDRTFVDASGARWIVDYKISVHEGGASGQFLDREMERYREQLENYAALFRKMEERPIRLGLYFPLMQAWRRWEYP